ncbi:MULTISPECIES: hypothetical protein [unclassified Pseudomonas]|uniref:hypothetical protein n=1 Tax=unclassified Pseudomonas TaxID=196821 RepID=UPI001D08CAC6|nr:MULTISPECIES: hypothetical protein [unclassified Pseudomonas]MCX4219658.1 hypothetical protein [Pseudomonas sp. MCal1]UDI91809.1 hypothetical protein I5961_22155 [Pseudomonas sp. IAC-BECa141]
MFRSANAAHFAFRIPAIRHDFKVVAFSGTETISPLYSIHIELVTSVPCPLPEHKTKTVPHSHSSPHTTDDLVSISGNSTTTSGTRVVQAVNFPDCPTHGAYRQSLTDKDLTL